MTTKRSTWAQRSLTTSWASSTAKRNQSTKVQKDPNQEPLGIEMFHLFYDRTQPQDQNKLRKEDHNHLNSTASPQRCLTLKTFIFDSVHFAIFSQHQYPRGTGNQQRLFGKTSNNAPVVLTCLLTTLQHPQNCIDKGGWTLTHKITK